MPIIQTNKELRPREENDFYPTPIELVRAALKPLKGRHFPAVLDPGCGDGVWGRVVRETFPDIGYLGGIDIVNRLPKNHPYDYFLHEDFLTYQIGPIGMNYWLICGNPPYKFAEQFIRRSWVYLPHNGVLVFLLRLAFLEGQKRCKGLWKEFPPTYVTVLGRRPSFTGNHKTDSTAYCLMYWYKDRQGETTKLSWLDWDYDENS